MSWFTTVPYRLCDVKAISCSFIFSQFWKKSFMELDAIVSPTAASTVFTPLAMIALAFSSVNLPARASEAALSHEAAICLACFLSAVPVLLKWRWPSGVVNAQNQLGRPGCRCKLAIRITIA